MALAFNSDSEKQLVDILRINTPNLNNYGADFAAYRYFTNDGNSFGLTTNPKWYMVKKNDEFYINQQKYFESEILFIINNNINYVSRSSQLQDDEYLKELHARSMSNSIGIYKFSPDKIEHFFFISCSLDHRKRDIMINKLDELKQVAQNVFYQMNHAMDDLGICPNTELKLNKSIMSCALDKYKSINNKTVQLNLNNNDIKLTKRELEIFKLLKSNPTNKYLAQHFAISNRTLEGYIDKLKDKLNCNRAKLIELSNLITSC